MTLNVILCEFWILIWKKLSHFILGGLKYYVTTFKFIIWYNALIVYIHVFTLYFFEYLHVITSVINLCNYIYN